MDVQICPRCAGKKYIWEEIPSEDGFIREVYVPCLTCLGQGFKVGKGGE